LLRRGNLLELFLLDFDVFFDGALTAIFRLHFDHFGAQLPPICRRDDARRFVDIDNLELFLSFLLWRRLWYINGRESEVG